MDESAKYIIGIDYVLKHLKEDIEDLFKVDISSKCRKIEYIKARSAFINILCEKYSIYREKQFDSSIFTDKVLNDFLNIDRCSIYTYIKNFKGLIQSSNSFHAKYNILYNKWVKKNEKFMLINNRIESLRKELESINERFNETYKMLII